MKTQQPPPLQKQTHNFSPLTNIMLAMFGLNDPRKMLSRDQCSCNCVNLCKNCDYVLLAGSFDVKHRMTFHLDEEYTAVMHHITHSKLVDIDKLH